MTWTKEEFNAYEDAIIAMTDEKGKIEFAIAQITGFSLDEIEKLRKN